MQCVLQGSYIRGAAVMKDVDFIVSPPSFATKPEVGRWHDKVAQSNPKAMRKENHPVCGAWGTVLSIEYGGKADMDAIPEPEEKPVCQEMKETATVGRHPNQEPLQPGALLCEAH